MSETLIAERATDTLAKVFLSDSDRDKYILNATFRCDTGSCGAQAYVRVTLKSEKELYFCQHHANSYEEALLPQLSAWYSESIRLQENRHQGSEN